MTAEEKQISAAFSGSLGDFTLDVSFDAPLQGITALFGPSGCGKTTTLRCVAGLNRMAGFLKVGEETWQDDSASVFRKPHQRAVGYVFQEASLFPHLSVRKNLLYGAPRDSTTSAAVEPTFETIVDLLGIAHLLDRAPQALSGGERQRIAIGRALLSRPKLLLMDEPLAALDRLTKEGILPYLESLHEQLSIPILYVTHDLSEVARLADRMIVLAEGRKLREGPVANVLERLDVTPETEGFFDMGVLLTARVVKHDPQFLLTYLDHRGQILVVPTADVGVGSEVRLRLRARDVALATQAPSGISIRNVLSGTVSSIVEDGTTPYAETLVDVDGTSVRARITRAAIADMELKTGMPVFVLVKAVTINDPEL